MHCKGRQVLRNLFSTNRGNGPSISHDLYRYDVSPNGKGMVL